MRKQQQLGQAQKKFNQARVLFLWLFLNFRAVFTLKFGYGIRGSFDLSGVTQNFEIEIKIV